MAPTDREQLISMGFSGALIDQALLATSNSGLQAAIDWMIANPDGSEHRKNDQTQGQTLGQVSSAEDTSNTQAKSFNCNECGKQLASADTVQLHAARTGHSDFSESAEEKKPLTEEEKAEKLEQLKQKMAQKRQEKARLEAEEAKERERIRRKNDKELSELREKRKEEDMRKAMDQRKKEKAEDRILRARIKAQIEEDRRARKEKAEQEKLGYLKPKEKPEDKTIPKAGSDFKGTRIQFRTNTGNFVQSFEAEDKLETVIEFLKQKLQVQESSITLMTTFPRKNFASEDYGKTLKELNLVPSVVLVVNLV